MTTTKVRPNNFPSLCAAKCGHTVAALEGSLTKGPAGWEVRHIGTCPETVAAKQEATAPLEPGFYMDGGDFYRLCEPKTTYGRTYFKLLHVRPAGVKADGTPKYKATWDYVGRKPFTFLTAADLLTQDEAKDFGLRYSLCIRCTKDLELAESVHVGYGRTCAGHMGWWYPTKKEMAAILAAEEADTDRTTIQLALA